MGESWLSADHKVDPDILIIDGWIKDEPIEYAAKLFEQEGYRFVIATGGYEGERWQRQRWSTAEIARRSLMRRGISEDKIIFAQAPNVEQHRSYSALLISSQTLEQKGIKPKSVTIFTRGAHAARSYLTATKIFGPDIPVGVISWRPPGTEATPWWKESSRAEDLLKETVGFLWEWLADSGR